MAFIALRNSVSVRCPSNLLQAPTNGFRQHRCTAVSLCSGSRKERQSQRWCSSSPLSYKRSPPCLRTVLFLKREEKVLRRAHLTRSDCVVIDMEDSVAPNAKKAARRLFREALLGRDLLEVHSGQTLCLRVNGLKLMDELLADLDEVVLPKLNTIMIPKAESAGCVRIMDELVSKREAHLGLPRGYFSFMPIIECPVGFFHTLDIASASPRVVAIISGVEDFVATSGGRSTPKNDAITQLQARVILAAKASGVQAIGGAVCEIDDFSRAENMSVRERQMGFDGKVALTERQTHVFQREFSVSEDELFWAKKTLASTGRLSKERQMARSILDCGEREKILDEKLFRHIHDDDLFECAPNMLLAIQ